MAGPASGQMIDSNENGMSDIWECLYNAYGADPNVDSDGDGFSNLEELLAGTNPFTAHSSRGRFYLARPLRLPG